MVLLCWFVEAPLLFLVVGILPGFQELSQGLLGWKCWSFRFSITNQSVGIAEGEVLRVENQDLIACVCNSFNGRNRFSFGKGGRILLTRARIVAKANEFYCLRDHLAWFFSHGCRTLTAATTSRVCAISHMVDTMETCGWSLQPLFQYWKKHLIVTPTNTFSLNG